MVITMPVQVLAGVEDKDSRACIVRCIKTSQNLAWYKQARIKNFSMKNQ